MSFEMEKGVTIQLSDHVKNVRKNADNELALISIAAQKLKDKRHNLCQHWIQHLALCATLDNFKESRIFGSDVCVVFAKVEKVEAKRLLENIVSAWHQNRSHVLPIAIKSVFAYLKKFDLNAAKTEYEDKYNGAEIDSDLYLKRLFLTFEELKNKGFGKWATELYLPIQQNANEV